MPQAIIMELRLKRIKVNSLFGNKFHLKIIKIPHFDIQLKIQH